MDDAPVTQGGPPAVDRLSAAWLGIVVVVIVRLSGEALECKNCVHADGVVGVFEQAYQLVNGAGVASFGESDDGACSIRGVSGTEAIAFGRSGVAAGEQSTGREYAN